LDGLSLSLSRGLFANGGIHPGSPRVLCHRATRRNASSKFHAAKGVPIHKALQHERILVANRAQHTLDRGAPDVAACRNRVVAVFLFVFRCCVRFVITFLPLKAGFPRTADPPPTFSPVSMVSPRDFLRLSAQLADQAGRWTPRCFCGQGNKSNRESLTETAMPDETCTRGVKALVKAKLAHSPDSDDSFMFSGWPRSGVARPVLKFSHSWRLEPEASASQKSLT